MSIIGPYAVVTFTDDGQSDEDEQITSEIPSLWLSADKSQCWWPTTKNITSFICRQIKPDPNDDKWNLCNIKFEAYFDTLEKARKKAENITSSSDENDIRDRGRGKRKKRTVKPSITNESTDTEDGPPREKRSMDISLPPDFNITNLTGDILSMIADMPMVLDETVSQADRDVTQSGSATVQNSDISYPSCSTIAIEQTSVSSKQLASTNTASLQSAQIISSSRSFIDRVPISDSPRQSISKNTELESNEIVSLTPSHQSSSFIRRPKVSVDQPAPNIIQCMKEQNSSLMEFIKDNSARVLASVAGVKIELSLLNARLEKLENQTNLPLSSIENLDRPTDLNVLPFHSTQQILDFEKDLLDPEDHPKLQSDLMQNLTRIGGNCMKDNTVRVLRRVFSNKVATKASWLGLRNNFRISNLYIIKMIKDAVSVKYPHTDKDFEELASEWFRQANQRYKREKNQQNQQQ